MSEGQAHLCLGLYDDIEIAERDYQSLKVLHSSGRVAAYDAAVVFKDADGKVAIQDRSHKEATATWTGVGIGAFVGLLFPPAIVATTLVGGVTGALVGKARAGLSKREVEELGRALLDNEVALVVVGDEELPDRVEQVLPNAKHRLAQEVDLDRDEFAKALHDEAERT
jgi:uncharacterized membrane protein